MHLSRRDLLLAGTVGLLEIVAVGRTAEAQRKLPLLIQSALDLEHAINWMFVAPSWGHRRFAWVAAVQGVHSPAQLAARLGEMEAVLGTHGIQRTWAVERGAWVASLSSVRTDAQAARILLTLEGALEWGATNNGWHVTRGRWVAALQAMH